MKLPTGRNAGRGHGTRISGTVTLSQNGSKVSGTYTHDEGQITGTVDGATLTGRWTEAPTRLPPQDAGDLQLTVNADCTALSGFWRYGDKGHDKDGEWAGQRVGPPPPPVVAPMTAVRIRVPATKTTMWGRCGALVNLALASRGAMATQSSTYTGSCPAGAMPRSTA